MKKKREKGWKGEIERSRETDCLGVCLYWSGTWVIKGVDPPACERKNWNGKKYSNRKSERNCKRKRRKVAKWREKKKGRTAERERVIEAGSWHR